MGPTPAAVPTDPGEPPAGAAPPPTLDEALARMADAENTLRAIGAGEIDAFIVADGGEGRRVFTLSTADRPYRRFVENMRDGAATISADGLVLYANQCLAELLSCPRVSIVGSPLTRYLAGGLPAALALSGSPGATLELDLVDGFDATVPVQVGVSPLEVDGEPLICLTFTDLRPQRAADREISRLGEAQAERLSDLQATQAALTRAATHDALTDLPNRALLVDRIEQAMSRGRRTGGCIAALFIDLDRFKQVNDNRGHAAGDAVLRHVAEILVGALRPMDTISRIGGDEFVVLLSEIDNFVHAVDISGRLLAELACRPVEGEQVVASVGIAVSAGGEGTAERLLHEADTAMHHAKSRGGGRAEVFDEAFGREIRDRARSRRDLQSALDEDRVIAHHQPVIDLRTGGIIGFEALARITSTDGSLLSPAAFIPVAEESGLVVPLGAQVLDLACAEAMGWPLPRPPRPARHGTRRLSVAVNLAARQFDAGDLPTVIREQLERTGMDPERLHLELTETAIIGLQPEILGQLAEIRDLGVEIGLDDFGTGYASLTHLRRLPLTFVKIDQAFVQGLGVNHEDERIVAAVIDLAANLGLRSIAEGVETDEQLIRLRALSCDQAQGYFFARPLPPGDVAAILEHEPW